MLLHLTKRASYNNHTLKAALMANIRHTINEIGLRGGSPSRFGGHAARRGVAQYTN